MEPSFDSPFLATAPPRLSCSWVGWHLVPGLSTFSRYNSRLLAPHCSQCSSRLEPRMRPPSAVSQFNRHRREANSKELGARTYSPSLSNSRGLASALAAEQRQIRARRLVVRDLADQTLP